MDPPVLARAGDPRLLRAGRAGARPRAARPLRRRGRALRARRRSVAARDRRPATTTRSTSSSRRRACCTIPGTRTSRASIRLRGRDVPQLPLGPRRARSKASASGCIGTGSTAVQIVGAVVDEVEHLTLFQRTAQWVLPQTNPAFTDEEQAAFREDPSRLAELHESLSEAFGVFANAVVDAESPEIQWIEAQCKANLEENVADPELRERLRPDYRAACKRLIISPNFYEAIQRPNAELVTESIERIERRGRPHRRRRAARARRARARHRVPRRRVHAPDGGHRPRRRDARRRVGQATERVPLHLDPGLPELLHAQRAERAGRQLLADRGRRAAVRLHPAADRAPPRG